MRVIRLRSVQVEVQMKLAAYLMCMRNSNMETRVAVSFCRLQQNKRINRDLACKLVNVRKQGEEKKSKQGHNSNPVPP